MIRVSATRLFAPSMRCGRLAASIGIGAIALAVGGCGLFGGGDKPLETKGPSVAELVRELPELATPEVRVAPPTRDDVLAAYRRVYGELEKPKDNHAVGKRLADLEMQVGEERSAAGGSESFSSAISLYEGLLKNAPAEDRDEILYQLSRAYDVDANAAQARHYLDRLIAEAPASEYIVEARFRRAEMSFSNDAYAAAAPDYAFVVEHGQGGEYWLNAAYMLGWCQFKESDLDAALESFFKVVDAGSAPDTTTPGVDGEPRAAPDTESPKELLDDTLRVIVLALAYQDGPKTLARHMAQLNKPAWQHLVYERLARDMREKQRYLDSVATYETFIENNPLDRTAPVFHQRVIETLIAGKFPSEIRKRKEDFVVRYGIRSAFWQLHGDAGAADYLPTLKSYLGELSQLAHAEAQKSRVRADYLKAADWYEQIIATFPKDPDVAEHLFLLGEVFTEADEDARAVAAYQRVVHEFPEHPRANEAGYAAILGLDELVRAAPAAVVAVHETEKVNAQIEFAMLFPDDPRAPAVQVDAADALFKAQRYREAVDLSEHLLRTRGDVDTNLRRTALAVVGHGRFELGEFAGAETAYRSLQGVDPSPEITEKLLASIYKQAEAAETTGDAATAERHFLRIRDEAPNSELAVKGQYDAIALVEAQGRLKDAADLLSDLRTRHPDHTLSAGAANRLADLYERSASKAQAAAEYRRVADADGDTEVRRQALYHAAELYLETEDLVQAAATFAAYTKTYREPADLRLEALDHLDKIAQRTGDAAGRRQWLDEKIALAGSSAAPSDRMRFLAAEAQIVIAEEARLRFEAVALTAPLEKSLLRKRDALNAAVTAYEKAASYQVQQFATQSTYWIAEIYADLSHTLISSTRPANLSALELEQYEVLLEEQAFPFEEQAIEIHEVNLRRGWEGVFDQWVERSLVALKELMPGRFDKQEATVAYVETVE